MLTDILVLSTVAKDYEDAAKSKDGADFWDSLEPHVIMTMKEMQLEDLINLMWSALEVQKGSDTFFREVEKQISSKILKIKDDEFQVLIGCFTRDINPATTNNFSERFM